MHGIFNMHTCLNRNKVAYLSILITSGSADSLRRIYRGLLAEILPGIYNATYIILCMSNIIVTVWNFGIDKGALLSLCCTTCEKLCFT